MPSTQIENRYHICSSLGLLVSTDSRRDSALERAGRMQRNAEPGEDFIVFDSMARGGQPEKWCFGSDGTPTPYLTRKAVAS